MLNIILQQQNQNGRKPQHLDRGSALPRRLVRMDPRSYDGVRNGRAHGQKTCGEINNNNKKGRFNRPFCLLRLSCEVGLLS